MKFSVAMCTFNGARYLLEQLESIAAQTRPPDELILCDDGSTDETVEIAQSFARTSSFPVLIKVNETNLGSTQNFDQALGLCEGELIAFSDQDDIWLPDKLSQLEQSFAPGVGLAFTNGYIVDDSLKPLGLTTWNALRFGENEQKSFRQGREFAVLVDHNVAMGAALAFRAEFAELIQPIPNVLVHDGVPVLHDWWAALLIAAVSRISFVAEPLIKYRLHAAQQMGSRVALDSAGSKPDRQSIHTLANRRNEFDGEIDYLRAILERVSAQKKFAVHPQVLDDLGSRLAHLNTRRHLPAPRLRRLPPVLRELSRRRYHRYSNGLFSALKDLWLAANSDEARVEN
jgi:glycosyltransferase involved in cell wall biosynthesis